MLYASLCNKPHKLGKPQTFLLEQAQYDSSRTLLMIYSTITTVNLASHRESIDDHLPLTGLRSDTFNCCNPHRGSSVCFLGGKLPLTGFLLSI
jgi:hypothetical protein